MPNVQNRKTECDGCSAECRDAQNEKYCGAPGECLREKTEEHP